MGIETKYLLCMKNVYFLQRSFSLYLQIYDIIVVLIITSTILYMTSVW